MDVFEYFQEIDQRKGQIVVSFCSSVVHVYYWRITIDSGGQGGIELGAGLA